MKREREERAEAERRRAEERKREVEAAARKAEYDRKAEIVKKLAHAWEESKLIKEFAATLKTTLAGAEALEDVKQELEQMINWSFRYADYLDPLTDPKWVIRQFKKPLWNYGY